MPRCARRSPPRWPEARRPLSLELRDVIAVYGAVLSTALFFRTLNESRSRRQPELHVTAHLPLEGPGLEVRAINVGIRPVALLGMEIGYGPFAPGMRVTELKFDPELKLEEGRSHPVKFTREELKVGREANGVRQRRYCRLWVTVATTQGGFAQPVDIDLPESALRGRRHRARLRGAAAPAAAGSADLQVATRAPRSALTRARTAPAPWR